LITIIPIPLVPFVGIRGIGGYQVNGNRFILTRYTRRPETSGRFS
jgi:hypothetical protein